MRYFVLLILIIFTSCKQAVEKPKHLISEEKMSTLLAEFALSDQINIVAPKANMETQTRYILKQHKVKAKDFQDSYNFYTGTNRLDEIFDDAQEIIIQKDPKAKDYINKKIKNEPLSPNIERQK